MNLLRPELIRLCTRRFTWISAVIGLLVLIPAQVLTWSAMRRASDQPIRYAHQYDLFAFEYNALGMVGLTAIIAGAVGYVAAAAYAGSEYATGGLGTWLGFVPRRGRVYASRVAAVGLATTAYTLPLVGVDFCRRDVD
ncbi:hypothetical protein [Granulicoccus phenolivorans]|uniref:hypothetical protein n=1 Tax=Granulicoccus phenolivorans TaxID=266854 RepID=UPI00040F71DF|nr:hypothetical protein [Granulicoccus phenolivorans]